MSETRYLDKIVMLPIKSIIPYENNARRNDEAVNVVMENIKQFGFAVPIILDKDNVIIAGHTRLKAAKRMKLKEVPCVIADYLDENQVRAMRLAENKSHEFATWDLDLMETEIAKITGIDLGALGFEGFEDLQMDDFPGEGEPDLEDIMQSEECIVEKGDIWQLGRHRLFCGDATNREEIAKMMDGEVASLIVTDPPYNMNLTGLVTSVPTEPGGKWGATKTRALENDNLNAFAFREFLEKMYEVIKEFLEKGKNAYIFHSYHSVDDFVRCCKESGMVYEQNLVWVKPSFSLSGSLYQHRYELCLLARNGGLAGDRTWNSGRSDSDVLEYPDIDKMSEDELRTALRDVLAKAVAVDAMERDRNTEEVVHSTMKPVPFLIELIRNSSNINELVVDLFGGSGSTLVASEQCSRVCYCCEIDPTYCTRIIRRWEKLTGKKAVKVGE